ncbi:LysR family transcriptional regulator [Nitrincola sp. MINF-07-Sa-05]|uniref:LysR family transcriptional regulator n=1 Tax=Nitrincola salilacus TaxID=3400273 RepID=UPI003917C447
MKWDDLRYFLSVARTGSLTESAKVLRVSPSTVSRRVSELEQDIGSELFIHSKEGYELNESGLSLLPLAEQAEAHLMRLERNATLKKDEISGVVRIALPELLGQYLIIPRLKHLAQKYPNIQLEILADVRSSRLTRGDADLLVRLSRPSHGDYTVQKLGHISQGLYAATDYIKEMGMPTQTAGLAGHRIISWDTELSYLPLAQFMEDRPKNPKPYIRAGNFNTQLQAVKSGIGISALPKFIAESSGLRRVFEEEDFLDSEIWLIKNATSRKLPHVNIVAEWISDVMHENAHLLHCTQK